MKAFYILLAIFLFSCSQSPEPDSSSELENEMEELTEVIEETAEAEETPETEEMIEESKSATEEISDEYVDIDWTEYEASMTRDFSFVILISTTSYDEAIERAKDASAKLGYPIDLRGHHQNDESGLSVSREVCENEICGGGAVSYPIYLPRSDYGESKYLSVEYSNGFDGFAKGYYIVVAASGEKGDMIINEALEEAQKFYPDAYAKTCGVYIGCSC